MKRLVLFTYRPEIGNIYYEDLSALFEGRLNVEHYALDIGEFPTDVCLDNTDIVLVSNEAIINQVYPLINKRAKIIVVDFAYQEISLEKMRQYPVGTYALVCFNPFVCRKMINLFYEYGINNFIWVIPQQGKSVESNSYDVAIVDDHSPHCYDESKPLIQLGRRHIAFSSLLKVAQEAEIADKELEKNFLRYCYSYKSAMSLVNSIYSDMSSFHTQVRLILNHVDSAIAILNEKFQIVEYNTHFLQLLHIDRPLYGESLQSISALNMLIPYLEKGQGVRNQLITDPEHFLSFALSIEHIRQDIDQRLQYLVILEEMTELEEKNSFLKRQLRSKGYTAKYHFSDIKTASPIMKACLQKAARIAQIDKTTLIVGESGTGKELMAQSIHNASRRKNSPFVSINCAALPPTLLESELFGYTEGAFTGAKKGGKSGLFEMANHGTLFLDEIGEASLEVQSKLLRAIETKEIMRLGSDRITAIDVRIIAATNRNLQKLVDEKTFRLDLYYRLNAILIQIPPLRKRCNDAELLAKELILQETGNLREMTPEFIDFLIRYSWAGNVRELRNVVEYMVNITDGPLKVCDLPDYILENWYDVRTTEEFPGIAGEDPASFVQAHSPVGIRALTERYSGREMKMIVDLLEQIRTGVKSRQMLAGRISQMGTPVSDYKLRQILNDMKSVGLLSFSRGPAGISLTPFGLEALGKEDPWH